MKARIKLVSGKLHPNCYVITADNGKMAALMPKKLVKIAFDGVDTSKDAVLTISNRRMERGRKVDLVVFADDFGAVCAANEKLQEKLIAEASKSGVDVENQLPFLTIPIGNAKITDVVPEELLIDAEDVVWVNVANA